jgi:predicted PurR-regulated permease PerM
VRPEPSSDITRVVLFVLVIGALLLGSLWTLLPFLSGMIWATTIAVATWPPLLRLERATGGRRALAVVLLTVTVLLVFIVPFALAVTTLLDAARRSPTVMSDFLTKGLGPPPAWIRDILAVGVELSDRWQSVAAGGPQALVDVLQPYGRSAAAWAIAATGGFGRIFVLVLLLTALVQAVLAGIGLWFCGGMHGSCGACRSRRSTTRCGRS